MFYIDCKWYMYMPTTLQMFAITKIIITYMKLSHQITMAIIWCYTLHSYSQILSLHQFLIGGIVVHQEDQETCSRQVFDVMMPYRTATHSFVGDFV